MRHITEAEAAIEHHVRFLLELLGPDMTDAAVAPEVLLRDVDFLRRLAQRRMRTLG